MRHAVLVVALALLAPGARVEGAEAGRPFRVRITGSEYTWQIRYPGPDGRPGTSDDVHGRRHLHLPANARVRIELRSDDYAYGFFLPQFDVLEVAIPGRSSTVELQTWDAGVYELLGNQMCGFTHPELIGEVVVQEPDDLALWLGSDRTLPPADSGFPGPAG